MVQEGNMAAESLLTLAALELVALLGFLLHLWGAAAVVAQPLVGPEVKLFRKSFTACTPERQPVAVLPQHIFFCFHHRRGGVSRASGVGLHQLFFVASSVSVEGRGARITPPAGLALKGLLFQMLQAVKN